MKAALLELAIVFLGREELLHRKIKNPQLPFYIGDYHDDKEFHLLSNR
jgi:hypothetical protein